MNSFSFRIHSSLLSFTNSSLDSKNEYKHQNKTSKKLWLSHNSCKDLVYILQFIKIYNCNGLYIDAIEKWIYFIKFETKISIK